MKKILFLLTLILFYLPSSVIAENILLLHSYDKNLKSVTLIDQGIDEVFTASGKKLELFTEYLDLRRAGQADYLSRIRDAYAKKYADWPIEVIIVTMIGALDFVLAYGEELFPGVPVVFCTLSRQELDNRELPPHFTGLYRDYDFAGTLELALRLHPRTKHVAIAGHRRTDQNMLWPFAEPAFKAFQSRVDFLYFPEQSIDAWTRGLATLPPDSLIFYINLWKFPDGKPLSPLESLHRFAPSANAPVYGIFDTYLGNGIVGGHLDSYLMQGRKAAEVSLRILNGEQPQDIPIGTMDTNAYMFHWPQLQRWGVDEAELPPGSIVTEKPPSLWDAYKWWIISGIAVFATESLLLMLLLVQREIRRRAEGELQKYREHLEVLVDGRTQALAESNQQLALARDKAEAANHAKSKFLASMSHELRTPLNAVLGYAKILRRQPDKLDEGTRIIEHSGRHLLGLINDLLDLAKIEAGKLELVQTRTALPVLLRDVITILHERAEAKGLCLRLEADADLPANVVTDEKRLRQVLLNLLGNAVKFTDTGGVTLRVTLTPTPLPEGERLIRFTIEDTGIGIPPEAQAKIFQPFEQTESARQQGEGTGLGLDISRRLVGLMGGEIQVRSDVGKGSCFSFVLTFPLCESGQASAVQRQITGYHGPRRGILVVDDRVSNRQVLRALLEILDFEVREADNGLNAIQQVQTKTPDLILMDIMMPEMDGIETTSRIHAVPGLQDLPIVAVSASVSNIEFPLMGPESGESSFSGCLHKPIEEAKLFEYLENLLNLEWRYAEAGNGSNAEFIPPPTEVLQELYELAKLAKIPRLQEWAEEHRADYPVFTEKLAGLAREFDDRGLLKLLKYYLR